jgi:hypothetical protein
MQKLVALWKKQNPLVRAFLLFISGMLLLAFLFAPEKKPLDLRTVSFTHTSSSLLYFKNIRSFYYNVHVDKKSRFTLYRLKRRNIDTTQLWLQFTIVSNPLMDESYIYTELNLPEQNPHPVVLLPRVNGDITLPLNRLNNESHYALAAEVFNQLLLEEPLYLMHDRDTIQELFATKQSRYTARIVLEDYFKLVNKL